MALIDVAQSEAVNEMRERIAYFGQMLFERHLTDAAGGNISSRVSDLVCLSPRYSGSKRQWRLTRDDVLVVDLDGNLLVGDGDLSRESNVHLNLHKRFSEHGSAVIHAHAKNILVFAALARSMPPALEATRKFGITPTIDYAPAHSKRLADNVVSSMVGREHQIRKHAAGTIAPWHGLFLMGKDLAAAFDAVERLDTNAYCLMMSGLLGASPMLENERALMESTIDEYTE